MYVIDGSNPLRNIITCEAAFIRGVIPSELAILRSIPSSIRMFRVLRSPWATANMAADLDNLEVRVF